MNWSTGALKVCLICDAVFCLAILGGCAYIVFWMGQSGWWFVLAVLLSGSWSCKPYRSPEQIVADAKDDNE